MMEISGVNRNINISANSVNNPNNVNDKNISSEVNNSKNIERQKLIEIQQNLAINFEKALDYDSIFPRYLNSKKRNEIISAVEEASKKYGVDKELILAVITKESGFNYKATSKVGAKGLMQLNSDTVKFINSNNKDLKINNPYDIKQNIMGGTYYLKYLLNKFNGDLRLVLDAYNAGPNSKTVKILKKYDNNVDISKIPINKETKTYIKKVLDYYQEYLKYYK